MHEHAQETVGTPLPGGRTHDGRIVRAGHAVVRPADDDGRLERVLIALDGVAGAPRWLGRDAAGRGLVEWVPGEAPEDLAAPPLSDDAAAYGVGTLLRRLHDETVGVAAGLRVGPSGLGDPTGAAAVVCHCDPTPGNVVFRDGGPVAFIDWEYAGPGRPAWDLAVALHFWGPLRAPQNLRPGEETLDAAARCRALLDGYRADANLRAEAVALLQEHQRVAGTHAVAVVSARGPERYAQWVARGGLTRIAADAQWLATGLPHHLS